MKKIGKRSVALVMSVVVGANMPSAVFASQMGATELLPAIKLEKATSSDAIEGGNSELSPEEGTTSLEKASSPLPDLGNGGTLEETDAKMFTFDETTQTITGYTGTKDIRQVVVPKKINSIEVKHIAANAFAGNSVFSEVIIQDGVETIGDEAFRGCKNLVSIEMGSTITSIGTDVFAGTERLRRIHIMDVKDSVLNQPWGAPSYTKVFWNNEAEFGDFVYNYNDKEIVGYNGTETNVVIPSGFFINAPWETQSLSVGRIGQDAFRGNTTIETLDMGRSAVQSIKEGAFADCINLKTVTLPQFIKEMDSNVFTGSDSITNISVQVDRKKAPAGVTDTQPWGAPATADVKYMGDEVSFSTRVTQINDEYARTISVTAYTNNGTIQDIKYTSADGTVTMFHPNNSGWMKDLKVVQNGTYTFESTDNNGETSSTAVVVDNIGMPFINSKAVAEVGSSSVSTLTDAKLLEILGAYAFDEKGARDITISAQDMQKVNALQEGSNVTIKLVSTSAFEPTRSTEKEITIYSAKEARVRVDFLVRAGDGEFGSISKSSEVVLLNQKIGNAVPVITTKDNSKFLGWYKDGVEIRDFSEHIVEGRTTYEARFEPATNRIHSSAGASTNLEETDESMFVFDDATGTITAYQGTHDIRWVVVPKKIRSVDVRHIGDGAFANNKDFSEIIIQDGLETIGDNAFKNSTNLVSIEMGSTVTSIGTDAFAGATRLKEIHLTNTKDSVTGQSWGAPGYTKVFWNGESEFGDFIYNTDEKMIVKYTGSEANVVIPASFTISVPGEDHDLSVGRIGKDAFKGNTTMETLNMDRSAVQFIKDGAFADCTNLKTVSIPQFIKEMDPNVFTGSNSITNINVQVDRKKAPAGVTNTQPWGAPTTADVKYIGDEVSFSTRVTQINDEYARTIAVTAYTNNGTIQDIKYTSADGTVTMFHPNDRGWTKDLKVVQNGTYTFESTDSNGKTSSAAVVVDNIGMPFINSKAVAEVGSSSVSTLTEAKLLEILGAYAFDEKGARDVRISAQDIQKVNALQEGDSVAIKLVSTSVFEPTRTTEKEITIYSAKEARVPVDFLVRAGDGEFGSISKTSAIVLLDRKLGTEIPTVTTKGNSKFLGWYKDGVKIPDLAEEIVTGRTTYEARFEGVKNQPSTGGGSSSGGGSGSGSPSTGGTAVNKTESVSTVVPETPGNWKTDEKGWQFAKEDGTPLQNDWAAVNGEWYFFDEAGYMKTGWVEKDAKWYYMSKGNGAMATGWVMVDGQWNYLDENGVWDQTKTLTEEVMPAGDQGSWIRSQVGWSFADQVGNKLTSQWVTVGGQTYYAGVDGVLAHGWLELDGKKYYLDDVSGAMLTGTVYIEGQWHQL